MLLYIFTRSFSIFLLYMFILFSIFQYSPIAYSSYDREYVTSLGLSDWRDFLVVLAPGSCRSIDVWVPQSNVSDYYIYYNIKFLTPGKISVIVEGVGDPNRFSRSFIHEGSELENVENYLKVSPGNYSFRVCGVDKTVEIYGWVSAYGSNNPYVSVRAKDIGPDLLPIGIADYGYIGMVMNL